MAEYGGMGGLKTRRELNIDDKFEMTIYKVFGDKIKSDDDFCQSLWQALANVEWTHENGDIADYSFRAAGDLIAAIRGGGNYLDWYCRRTAGVVSQEISEKMELKGWDYEYL